MRASKSIELHGSINPFQSLLRNAFSGHGWAMQTAQDYTALKAQLEEKVANLKRERDSVLRDVESLSQKVALKELERQARSL